jgi:hypothetical protein
VPNIFVSQIAKEKMTNQNLAYDKSNNEKTIPQLTYYTRCYSTVNGKIIEHGSGFIISFVKNENVGEEYTSIDAGNDFRIFVGPSSIFDSGTHFIDWSDGKFKLNSTHS